MPKINFLKCLSLLIAFLFVSPLLNSQEFLDLPKPTHSSGGLPVVKLKTIAEIKADFDKDLFFARPSDISVGKEYLYVYDSKLQKIFIFDSKYKYIGQFLDQGQGPGEVNSGYPFNRDIYAAEDGCFYVHDAMSDKLIQFSATGKYMKDTLLRRLGKAFMPFCPIIDKDGYLYTYSINNGIIDKFDSKMNLVDTFLNLNLNKRFVVFKPTYEKMFKTPANSDIWVAPNDSNTYYDLTCEGELFIYLYRSSTVFIIDKKKQVQKFDILIDSVLQSYKKELEKIVESKKKRGTLAKSVFFRPMFGSCFVDHDEPYFYLLFSDNPETSFLYQIDLKGKLIRMIINPGKTAFFKAKRNGLFYGFEIMDKNPIVFKVEETK